VRRLLVILAVAAIMAATMLGTALAASAQIPGAPTCGPWQQARYVSASGWPYFWWWRWCIIIIITTRRDPKLTGT
jgi:hypothetical protein